MMLGRPTANSDIPLPPASIRLLEERDPVSQVVYPFRSSEESVFSSTRVVFVSYVFVVTNELCDPSCQIYRVGHTHRGDIWHWVSDGESQQIMLAWICPPTLWDEFAWAEWESGFDGILCVSTLSPSRAMNFLLGWVEVYVGIKEHDGLWWGVLMKECRIDC